MPLKVNGNSYSWYVVIFVLGLVFSAGANWVTVVKLKDAPEEIAVLKEKLDNLEDKYENSK